jgi:hypothetical protein
MPNHCTNQLTLESGESLFGILSPYLIDKGEGDFDFDFQKIIPMDEKLLEGEDWYSWRVVNWGTKWDGYDGRFNSDDFSSFSFETAWAPPLPIIKKLAELTGQTFILEYIEYGMFFCGKYTASPEEDHDEFYNDIETAPQELLDSLGYEPCEEEMEEV